MILEDLLVTCMDRHAVENCRACPEQPHCLLLKVIREQSRHSPESLEQLLPLLGDAEREVVWQVARDEAPPEDEPEQRRHPIRVPPLFLLIWLILLKILEWVGYGFMALIGLGLAAILAYVLGAGLWWLLLLLAQMLARTLGDLSEGPVAQPTPEPTPWVSPTPADREPGTDLPRVPWGRLRLSSDQGGLVVKLWDEVENKQLLMAGLDQQLPAGPYQLQAEKDGFSPFHAHLLIRPAATTSLRIGFKPTAGRLRVRTLPARAQVKVDGSPRGTTETGSLVITGLASGTHDLEISLAGYRKRYQRVELAPRHDHDLTLSLQQAVGRLDVATRPAAAEVLVDDRVRGNSGPAGRWQGSIPAGPHAVGIQKSGYQPAPPVPVTVADGGTRVVRLELQPAIGAGDASLDTGSKPLGQLPVVQGPGAGNRQVKPRPSPAAKARGKQKIPAAGSSAQPAAPDAGTSQQAAAPGPIEAEPNLESYPTYTGTYTGPVPEASSGPRPPDYGPPSDDWPVFAGNPSLTGSRDDRPLRRGHLLWRTPVGRFTRAVTVGNGVYLGSKDGNIYGLDRRNGRVRWRVRTGGPVWCSPVIRQGRLYIGSDDGYLYALATGDGKVLWRESLGAAVRGSPSLVGGLVVAGTEGGRLVALRLQAKGRGLVAWSVDAGGPVRAAPVVTDSVVMAGTRASNILAVDALSGRRLWDRAGVGWKIFSLWDTLGPVRVPIAAGMGRLFVSRTDNKDSWTQSDLHALDPHTGEQLASGSINGYGTAPVYYGGAVYLGSGDGHLYSLDAVTLAPRWRYNTRHYLTSAPAVAGGQVAFGCFDHALYVLRAADGRLLYRLPTRGIVSSAATMVGGQLFFGSEDGYIYAYE